MKKVILVLISVVSILSSFSQIEKINLNDNVIQIGEVKVFNGYNNMLVCNLTYSLDNKDTICNFMFLDGRFRLLQQYDHIKFLNINSTLDQLYTTLLSALNAEKGAEQTIKLGNTNVLIKTDRSLGIKYITIAKIGGGFCSFTEKQLNKLFNK